MTISKLLLALCFALCLVEAQMGIINEHSAFEAYKGKYMLLFFIPDLKKTCLNNLLAYSKAYDDFTKSLDVQILIISSDGAATEEDIQIPIIANSQLVKDQGMEGVNSVMILDHYHRLRNIQITNLQTSRSVKDTAKLVMGLKVTDKENRIAIPREWQTINDATIHDHSVGMMKFYANIPISPVPVTENGIDYHHVEEIWTGPAAYGDDVNSFQGYVQFRIKCFRYDGTVYKDWWNTLNTITPSPRGSKANSKISTSCFKKIKRQDALQIGKTSRVYCTPDTLNKNDKEWYNLHNQMTYCEIKPEDGKKEQDAFMRETEPPAGEWNGQFLVARISETQHDEVEGTLQTHDGSMMMVHIHVTDVNDHNNVIFTTFDGDSDPEMFIVGGQRTLECLNRAFQYIDNGQQMIIYCPAELINDGHGSQFSHPGMPLRIIIQHSSFEQ